MNTIQPAQSSDLHDLFRHVARGLSRPEPPPGPPPGPCRTVLPERGRSRCEDRYEPSGYSPAEVGGQGPGIDLKAASKTIGRMLASAFGDRFDGATITFDKARLTTVSGSAMSVAMAGMSEPDGAACDYSASYQAFQHSRFAAEGTITTADGKTFDFKFFQTSGQAVSASAGRSYALSDWPSVDRPVPDGALPAAEMTGRARPLGPPDDGRMDRMRALMRQLAAWQDQTPGGWPARLQEPIVPGPGPFSALA